MKDQCTGHSKQQVKLPNDFSQNCKELPRARRDISQLQLQLFTRTSIFFKFARDIEPLQLHLFYLGLELGLVIEVEAENFRQLVEEIRRGNFCNHVGDITHEFSEISFYEMLLRRVTIDEK